LIFTLKNHVKKEIDLQREAYQGRDNKRTSSSSSADDDEAEMLDSLQSFQFEAQTKERDNPFS
jgi:hypothetical protein